MIGKGYSDRYITEEEMGSIVAESLQTLPLDGERVLVIIPDGTRSMPMPLMFDLFERVLSKRVKSLDYLVALGTHQPMNDMKLSQLVGRTVVNGITGTSHIFNHEWINPANFIHIGTLPKQEIGRITNGLMAQDVMVKVNKLIFDYDQLIICGPVFPHEVVGFSGGNKYFFPGIAGPEIIDFTHWLGALMTNYETIGKPTTPVRAVINRAAEFIDRPIACFSLVVTHEGLAGIFFGSVQESWQAAVDLSEKKHIKYVTHPFQKVISVMPKMYDDMWTAAKGMYKMEPAIADGGEVIIYAPHISEVSYTHGKLLDEVGYHCRDYFTKQWEKFKHYPGTILAHSTHLKGKGKYDANSGIETPRIQVILATRISAERCHKINLGYLNPDSIDLETWKGQEDQGILVVPNAGETLYRVRS